MQHRTLGKVGAVLLVLACGSQAVGARAADEAIALGGVYGYFVEAGVGLHLVSNVHIADRNMTTAFNFGTQAAIGATFGDGNRYKIAALIHHVSNGGIKAPNNGLTYAGIRLRVELP